MPASASTSRQALPAPPITTCSSTVTKASCVAASSRISSASMGLTKRMLTTVASSASPAIMAGATIDPKARMATRLPWRRTSALPRGSSVNSFCTGTPGPVPRG